jgi:carboxymethylenebutenolidase
MRGGFALLLAAAWAYNASSVNYGGLPKDAEKYLAHACPIVASYGAKDPTLRRAPDQLEQALSAHGIPRREGVSRGGPRLPQRPPAVRDAQVGAGHGCVVPHCYHEPSALDVRARIVHFFSQHLVD